MDSKGKCPLHPELQPTARRQNQTATDRNSCFTDSPAKLQSVWTSTVFLAQNFLHIVSILHFSLHSKTSFLSFILFHEAAARMMLGGSFGVASQWFRSGVTHSNSAVRSRSIRRYHIFQCRQERSLGPDTISSPYGNNNQRLETNVSQE